MIKFLSRKNINRTCTIGCLLAALMLPACGAQQVAPESQPIVSEPQTSITATQPETVASQPAKKENEPITSKPIFPDEYSLEQIGQWVDIDTFISAEMLQSRFGSFDIFSFEKELEETGSPFTGSKYRIIDIYEDYYTYTFSEKFGGNSVYFKIEKLQEDGVVRHILKTEETLSSSDINPEDLRKSAKPGTYWLGDIGYTYWYLGQRDPQYSLLRDIHWKSNGYVFCIANYANPIETYALDDGGFVSQLLREETAPEAIEQFAKELFPEHYPNDTSDETDKKDSDRILWIVPSAIVFFVITATTFILIRRKRKKKAITVVSSEEAPGTGDGSPDL